MMTNFNFYHQVKFTLIFPIDQYSENLIHRIITSEISAKIGDYQATEVENYSFSNRKIEYRVWSSLVGRINSIVMKILSLKNNFKIQEDLNFE
jgi:hypothetical protein